MSRMRIVAVGAVTGLATLMAFASSAAADTVAQQGAAQGDRYRGGVPALGGVSYRVALTIARDPAGDIVNVGGYATIAKRTRVAKVQIDRIALGTAAAGVRTNPTPANSGTGPSAVSVTNWAPISPRTCTGYRVRATFSIRWADGALSTFSILSPLSTVCGPTSPPAYRDCAALNARFPHGVGRPGAVDSTSGTPVTNYYVSSYIYSGNTHRDADHDGIACERP